MRVIGLTGLIGSGKSTVANMFADYGVPIVDTDMIAHELTGINGLAMPAIINQFGIQFADETGALLRVRMRELIFHDSAAREMLESILHPMIFSQAYSKLQEINYSDNYAILVVPLLFKSQRYLQLTVRNIFVTCNYATIVARLKVRNGFSAGQINGILATQLTSEVQIAMADDIIHNTAGLDYLELQVKTLHQKYLALRQYGLNE